MCGLSGHFNSKGIIINDTENILTAMANEQSHRGPDSFGIYTDNYVGFSFRRLKILDLEKGDQPMVSHDDNYVMVFNGEIYNYQELKSQLDYPFKTKTDTGYTYYKFLLFLFGVFFIILSEFNIQYIDFYSNSKLLLICFPLVLISLFYVLLILKKKMIFK